MKGDFSRLTFDSTKQFSRVRMQQGRVMLDADWNELNDILLYYMRTLGADLIGPHGGPVGNVGFGIQLAANNDDFAVGTGRYYVDGIFCNQALERLNDKPVTYTNQPYYPLKEGEKELPEGDYLAYLDIWERHVTYLEDSMIRELALGGPDTATRAQIIWQVKIVDQDWLDEFQIDANDCADFPLEGLRKALQGNPPRLKARVKKPSNDDTDPCVTSPESRYRGAENQLYRVEIHRVNTDGKATFKWSRENGSVIARWLQTKGSDLIVSGIRDAVKGFQAGDWVELIHGDLELRGEPGVMVQLSKVEGDVLTIDTTTASGTVEADPSKLKNPKVRRWEQKQTGEMTLEEGAIPVEEGLNEDNWIILEDGLEIQFQLPGGDEQNTYRSGDYWLIPARVATGDIEWPDEADNPESLPPHGIEHHYAPLAFVSAGAVTDLRKTFAALAQCFNL